MHPKFEIPTDPHGKHRYESAMKHVEAAKKAGKSSDEIHAIFKKVMEFNPRTLSPFRRMKHMLSIALPWCI